MRKKIGGDSSYFFCYRAMSERVRFFAFLRHEKTMTLPLFPSCCGNNRGKIPLLESYPLARTHYVTHNKLKIIN